MRTPRILIVEDDEMVGSLLAAVLTRSGYTADHTRSAAEMAKKIATHHFAAVILDLGLPDEDGLVLARKLRSTSQVPILVLTARQGLDDRLSALDLGVDDYLIKPCEPEEIVLRVRNLLRRAGEGTLATNAILPLGDFVLNVQSRTVQDKSGQEVNLTKGEFDIANALANAPNRVLSRAQLQDALSGGDSDASLRSVDILVARLRRKLGYDAKSGVIQTMPGLGYRLRKS